MELILDDFTTGPDKATLTGGSGVTSLPTRVQKANVPGGFRRVQLEWSRNTYAQPGSFGIPKKGPMVVSMPIKTNHRLTLRYGSDAAGENKPLNLNLSAFNTLRAEFDCLDHGLNWGATIYSKDGSVFVNTGANIDESTVPYVSDIPFPPISPTAPGFSFDDIDYIYVYFQTLGFLAGSDYALRKLSFIHV